MASRAAAATVLVVGALALTGCASDVTAPKLDRSVATTFGNLYAYQQTLLGQPGAATRNLTAACTRAGAAQSGAGDGWTCTVVFVDPSGQAHSVPYDMSVLANGCWHADGPPGAVGRQTEQAADGRTVVNPLYAFDGCFPEG